VEKRIFLFSMFLYFKSMDKERGEMQLKSEMEAEIEGRCAEKI